MANAYIGGAASHLLPFFSATPTIFFLTAFQDLDGNGIQSFGEPWDNHLLSSLNVSLALNIDLAYKLDGDLGIRDEMWKR